MNQNLFNVITCCVAFLISVSLFAGEIEQGKNEKIGFSISKNASIELNNKYGDIQVVEWEYDSIHVVTDIIASADDMEDLKKLMNMVKIVSWGSEDNVIISTEWAEGSNIFRKGTMDFKNMIKSDRKLTINYKVYIPTTCRLNINNRFGNVYLPKFEGALRIEIFHGDLRAREISDARNISVKYGKVIIKSINTGLLKVEYGTLILDKAESLTLQTKSSNIEILEINRLAIRSRNDEMRIDNITSLRGESSLSHLRIRRVIGSVNLICNYGDVTLKEILAEFKTIRFDGNNTDFDLSFSNDAAYRFDVESYKTRGFSYPINATLTEEKQILKDTMLYEGYEKEKDAKSVVRIKTKNSYIAFSQD